MMAKLTSEIIDEIIASFERVGGADYLDELAMRDPPTFCKLLARVIPAEIRANVQIAKPIDLGKEMIIAEKRLADGRTSNDQS